jgi:putative membrane-bound dehydrogenase-like protein
MKRLLALVPLFALQAFAAPVPLFDGKTLDGWESPTPELWKVEDGCLTGGDGTTRVPHNDFLCTKASFSNFTLRLKIKLTGDPKTGLINSGVQIRTARIPGHFEVSGYQCDYGDPDWWGAIYDEGRRNKLLAKTDMAALDPVLKRGDWNEYVIRAEGPRVQTWINGVLGVNYLEAEANIAQDGIIGFQVHGGGNTRVQVKDVTLEELPATPDAPTWDKVGRPGGRKAAAGNDSEAQENTAAAGKPMKEGNAPNAGQAKTPPQELATFKVPDGFEVQLVAAESEGIGKFVPLAFDQHGALWTTTAFEYPVDGNENPAAADALYASKAKDKVLVFDPDPQSPTGLACKPRVFAEGLAIPLGVLPYKNGCYVQHGHDIAFLEDTDADGKADKRTVILTGFGVQDSHLFPHQFTRAPGGWIWMAQGAFNYGKVSRPDHPEEAQQFDQTRMAKFRPDGSGFDITSNGPCNIWGLVLNGEGEAFIQEANDFGYPVMPFHEYANYPGCSDRQWKSYAPEFPGTAPDFKMGGTGLSGLALTDKAGPFPEPWRDVMLVANPITNRIQGIKMHRDGPRWRLDPPTDFLVASDPWFRPVAITVGPDGCLYIVDWYNKIISHNEVPRNHPDRDKTRGRIWRVKATVQKPFDVPDFTKLNGDELIAKLGGDSLAQSHLAWQAIGDRGMKELAPRLREIVVGKPTSPEATRIAALWALEALNALTVASDFPLAELLIAPNRNIRRELARTMSDNEKTIASLVRLNFLWQLLPDADPEVRFEAIRSEKMLLERNDDIGRSAFINLLERDIAPLAEPVAPSTKNGKPIKVREAYEREFERYLVRMFLERHPDAVAKFLDSDAAKPLPIEARLLASLALEPKASAGRVAKLLPQLQRAPGQEEVLRLAQFPGEPGVGDALRALLSNPTTRAGVLESLLATRTRLDSAKLTPFLAGAARQLLAATDASSVQLGAQLAGAFQLTSVEDALIAVLNGERELPARPAGLPSPAAGSGAGNNGRGPSTNGTSTAGRQDAGQNGQDARAPLVLTVLRALAQMGSAHSELFAKLAEHSADLTVRDEALTALAASKAADAPQRLLELWPRLAPGQQRTALGRLSTTKPGAQAIIAALKQGTLAKSALDAAALDRLQAVLGEKDPDFAALAQELGTLFRPVLALDGSEAAWTETGLPLDGPFTVESWVRLDPGIDNNDGLLGASGKLDINFSGARLRVWVGGGVNDAVVSKKPMTPDLWTHVAVTRDSEGRFKLYQDGELVSDKSKPAPGKFENVRVAWTQAKGGTAGALSEFRIWNIDRTPDAIRRDSDRSYLRPATGDGKRSITAAEIDPLGLTQGLIFASASDGWGKLGTGAKIVKTSDFPPILTADEAAALDAKYAKNRALAAQPGDPARGKLAAALCQACHLMGPTGGNIGPNLSGVGAMGTEAILRNILQPNAAMENGYRIYRVELKSGDLVDALFVSEDKDAVVVRLPGSDDRRIAKSDIRAAKYLRRSLMPEGLLDAFTPEQVSDLFTYLRTLK